MPCLGHGLLAVLLRRAINPTPLRHAPRNFHQLAPARLGQCPLLVLQLCITDSAADCNKAWHKFETFNLIPYLLWFAVS